MNEKKLNAAFRAARSVILVFSVRESGKFQGTFIPYSRTVLLCCDSEVWTRFLGCTCRFCTSIIGVQPRWLSHPLGSSCWHERKDAGRSLQDRLALQVNINKTPFFCVFFAQRTDNLFLFSRRELPFTKTAHLSNPWNEHKPVKIGRDGQVCETLSFNLSTFVNVLINSQTFLL